MALVARRVYGNSKDCFGRILAGEVIKIRPKLLFGDDGLTVAALKADMVIQSDGSFEGNLYTYDDGSTVAYECVYPGGTQFDFNLLMGDDIELETLRQLYQLPVIPVETAESVVMEILEATAVGGVLSGNILEPDFAVPMATAEDLEAKADDADVVHKTGDESIDGIKTFLTSPVVPAPETALQVANKQYVDENGGGSGGDFNNEKWVARFTAESADVPTNKQFLGNFFCGPMGEAGMTFGNRAFLWVAKAEYRAQYLPDMSVGGAHVVIGGYDGGDPVTNRVGITGNISATDGFGSQTSFDSGVQRFRLGQWLCVLIVIYLPYWYVYVKGVPVKRGKGALGVDLVESGIALDYEADFAIGGHNHSKFQGLASSVVLWMEDAPFVPSADKTAVIRPPLNPLTYCRAPSDGSIRRATAAWDLGSNPGGHIIADHGAGLVVDGQLLHHPAVPAIGSMSGNYVNDYVNFPKSFYPQYELADVTENAPTDLTVVPAPSLLVNELFKRADVDYQNPNYTDDGEYTPTLGLGFCDDSGTLGALPWQRSENYGIQTGGGDGAGEYGGAFGANHDAPEFPYLHVGSYNVLAEFKNGGNHTPYFEVWTAYDEATDTGIQFFEYGGYGYFRLSIAGGSTIVNLADDVSGLHYVTVSPTGTTAYRVGMSFNSLEGAHGKARLYINGVLGITCTLGATAWTKGDGVGFRLVDGMLRCSYLKVSAVV